MDNNSKKEKHKIHYIDSKRLYYAFVAGSKAVIKNQNYLNKINVFPVTDGDTGTNMASTMHSIIEETKVFSSVKETFNSIADAALVGARGNSGIIFAQFILGLSSEIAHSKRIRARDLGNSMIKAVTCAYDAVMKPVEGTMLTVMSDWASAMQTSIRTTSDISVALQNSYSVACKSLSETPEKLKILQDNGVVDAGAKGFVDFLEGIMTFIHNGNLKKVLENDTTALPEFAPYHHSMENVDARYCCEAILKNSTMTINEIKSRLSSFGNSIIVAGTSKKIHLHIHTDNASELFFEIKDIGDISHIKVDDMQFQYDVTTNRKYPIALVSDTACDLPEDFIREHQIHMIPFQISFGEKLFLDKQSITSEQFYAMLKSFRKHPKSSQPNFRTMQNLFSFVSSHYESIIAIHISDKLSGAYKQSVLTANEVKDKPVSVFDSRNLSSAEGLIVMRTAQAIAQGILYEKIISEIDEWINKTKIFVDVNTLKYMVKGGRMHPAKGVLAKVLNIKPIVSMDNEGKGIAFGKSFSRMKNMKKILNIIEELQEQGEIWNYSIVHASAPERAEEYGEQLTQILNKKPAYIMSLSPVIGVHNGIGSVGISLMYK